MSKRGIIIIGILLLGFGVVKLFAQTNNTNATKPAPSSPAPNSIPTGDVTGPYLGTDPNVTQELFEYQSQHIKEYEETPAATVETPKKPPPTQSSPAGTPTIMGAPKAPSTEIQPTGEQIPKSIGNPEIQKPSGTTEIQAIPNTPGTPGTTVTPDPSGTSGTPGTAVIPGSPTPPGTTPEPPPSKERSKESKDFLRGY